jgi:NADP-dependent 3-hydroxy acid dehydrogenase YdfG
MNYSEILKIALITGAAAGITEALRQCFTASEPSEINES